MGSEAKAKGMTLEAKAPKFCLEDPRGQGQTSRTTSVEISNKISVLTCFDTLHILRLGPGLQSSINRSSTVSETGGLEVSGYP
jgi:hypothetical protein